MSTTIEQGIIIGGGITISAGAAPVGTTYSDPTDYSNSPSYGLYLTNYSAGVAYIVLDPTWWISGIYSNLTSQVQGQVYTLVLSDLSTAIFTTMIGWYPSGSNWTVTGTVSIPPPGGTIDISSITFA